MTDQTPPSKTLSTPWLTAIPAATPPADEGPAAPVQGDDSTPAPLTTTPAPTAGEPAQGAPQAVEPEEPSEEVLDMEEALDLEEVESPAARAAPPPLPPAGPPPPSPARPMADPLAPTQGEAEALAAPQAEGGPEAGGGSVLEAAQEAAPEAVQETAPKTQSEEPMAPERSPLDEALEAAREAEPRARLEGLLGEMEVEEDRLQKAVLCYEIGEVQEGPLGDEPAAIKSYSKALSLDPQLFPNLWAVRRVFWRRQLWPNLLKLIDAELKLVTVPVHRVSLLMEKGDVLRRHQEDADGGLACYEQAHAADPSQLAPILALEKMYRERGQLDALRATMEAHLAATEQPARKAALLLTLSQLEVLLPQGSSERRWEILGEALALAARPERILEEMERVARTEGHLEHQLEVLEHRKQALLAQAASSPSPTAVSEPSPSPSPTAASAPSPSSSLAEEGTADSGTAPPEPATTTPSPAQSDAALQIAAAYAQARLQARLLEKAGAPERAWDLLLPWRERLGGHPVLKGELLGLAARLGRWDELAKLLAEQHEEVAASERQGLRLEQALALHRAGRGEEAKQLLRGTLDSSAPHPVVLALQELTALGSGDTEGLLELLGRALDGLESLSKGDHAEALDAWRAELWTQRALLGLEAGEGVASVKEACRTARAAVPGYAPATDLLETLLLQEGAWSDLVALYKLELVGAPDERALQLLEALAEIQTVWLPNLDGRVDALLQLTVRLPSSLPHRLRLLDALLETGHPEDVIVQIEQLLDMTNEAPELAAELALQGAHLAEERLEDTTRAAALLGRGLDLCPGHPELSAQLEVLLRDGGKHEELVVFYRAEAARTLDDAVARRFLLQLAWVLERDLQRPKEAAGVYEQLWQRSPEDLGALALLGRALAAAGEHGRLAEISELLADGVGEPADQAALYSLLAELHEDQTGDDLRAEEAYLRARALCPEAAAPLYALYNLASRRRDWPKAAEILDELLRSSLPLDARRQVLSELAWLLEGPRGDASGAAEHWIELATLDPPVPTAFWAALRLAVSRREWGEAASALDWLAGMAEKAKEPALMAALTCRAAAYGAVAGVAPGPRLIKAAQAGSGGEMAHLLASDLSPMEGQEAAARLRRRLGDASASELRPGFELPLAILLHREGRVREAAELLLGRLTGTPSDLPRLVLGRHLSMRAGVGSLTADLCERIAAVLTDDEQAAVLLREGAEVAGDPAVAARLLGQALARCPRDGDALAGLVKNLIAMGKAAEAAHCIGHRLSQGVPDEEEVALRCQRAELRITALEDPEGAAVDLYQVLQMAPENGPAMVHLARLQAEDGAYGEAAALLQQRLDVGRPEDAAELRPVRLLLSEVLEREGRPLEEALEPLDALLLEQPGDVELLERKHAIFLRARDFSTAVAVLDERYRGLSDRKARAEGELRKAAVFRDLAANDEDARRALETARDLDPLNREAVWGLCELYRRFGDQESLKMVVSSALDSHREALRRASGLEADGIRFLGRLFKEVGSADGQLFALGAIEVLGELEREETQELKKLRGALVDRQPGRLTAELWSKYLLHPLALGSLTDLWELIGPATYQMWPQDLSVYGVGKSERMAAKNAAGVAKEIFDLAGSLGIVVEEIYLGGNQPTEIRGVGTATGATLVVGAQVGPRLQPQERHRLGAILAGVRLGTLALPSIPATDLEILVASAIREGQPEYRADLPADRMEELGKRLRKALSRKERKALPLTAVSAAGAGVDLERWRMGVARTLARVGLLCSGDLRASVEADGGLPGASRVIDDTEAKRELMLFALSEAHLELRRSLGVAR